PRSSRSPVLPYTTRFRSSAGMHMPIIAAIVVLVGGYLIHGATAAPKPVRAHDETGGHRIAFPHRGLLPLCLIGFAAFLVEGAGIDRKSTRLNSSHVKTSY